jgi:hypothetical protein
MLAMAFDPGRLALVLTVTDVFGLLQARVYCCPVIVELKMWA